MISIVVPSLRGEYPVRETPRERLLEGAAAIVTDANVAPLLPGSDIPALVLPPGEETKSLRNLEVVLDFLARVGVNRTGRIAVAGGGVVGDLGGFAAATYMRGIAYVQIPTTLLAMVDSSVGGKVGVDLAAGKNLAGSFHPPAEVRLDLSFLTSLPPREIAAGMAEAIKTGAILDADLLGRLDDLRQVVGRCIELKAAVVAEDEDERTGRRAILNFGHTIGHAIEAITAYRRFRHGEAVAIGMVLEARLGEEFGVTEAGVAPYLAELLKSHGLPTTLPSDLAADPLVTAMRKDKKADAGRLAFALVERLGSARLVPDVPEAAVRAIIARG